ncbi:uncharacterized protein KQ657_001899 [Scheffersomyces spartinae]|uniref:Uncharacterized protein n=1 Tax=Scheffersomyces spartinae TaxID=45513 RepID=A0A9P7V6C3_9ASCO|nr:uncharacterized protein KQ657_001899 [Scheffersomyces spartinae]KAG7192185.1 hypothetical protein KQ657_001899 [Scheffersomyces spartinae]
MAVEEGFQAFLKGRGIDRIHKNENEPVVSEFRQTSLARPPRSSSEDEEEEEEQTEEDESNDNNEHDPIDGDGGDPQGDPQPERDDTDLLFERLRLGNFRALELQNMNFHSNMTIHVMEDDDDDTWPSIFGRRGRHDRIWSDSDSSDDGGLPRHNPIPPHVDRIHARMIQYARGGPLEFTDSDFVESENEIHVYGAHLHHDYDNVGDSDEYDDIDDIDVVDVDGVSDGDDVSDGDGDNDDGDDDGDDDDDDDDGDDDDDIRNGSGIVPTTRRDRLEGDYYYGLRPSQEDSDDNLSVASDFHEDDDYKYTPYRENGDRRYSNNMTISASSKDIPDGLLESKWDFEAEAEDEKKATELGGRLSAWDTRLLEMAKDTDDLAYLTQEPLASQYADGLDLTFCGNSRLLGLPKFPKYKNNLSEIIHWNDEDFLIVAASSKLAVFRLNPLTFVPERICCLKFDTKPQFTTSLDSMSATWPHFPHQINFIKVFDSWIGCQCLGACVDDGAVLIWKVETIMNQVDTFMNRVVGLSVDENKNFVEPFTLGNVANLSVKIKPDLRIKLTSSVWGLDALSFVDSYGRSHNLLVASDNSQKITLLYYDMLRGRFYAAVSTQLLHNIPQVSFIDHYELADHHRHYLKIACSCVSSELVVFKTHFDIVEGPFAERECGKLVSNVFHVDPTTELVSRIEVGRFTGNQENVEDAEHEEGQSEGQTHLRIHGTESMAFKRIKLDEHPRVKLRTYLNQECWTVKPIDSKYFHEVSSLKKMCGDPYLEDAQEVPNIWFESEALKLPGNLSISDKLGGATNWQFFEAPVASFSNQLDASLELTAKLATVDDEYKRIHKGYHLQLRYQDQNQDYQHTRNKFLMVTTAKRIAMYRSDTLFCNAGTRTVFDVKLPHDEEGRYSNRILLSLVIPQLSCFVASTQQGLVSIFRLCLHRGVYGMRQEHLFPNVPVLTVEPGVCRTIVGIAARDISVNAYKPRFVLYLTFSDGLIFAYSLSK